MDLGRFLRVADLSALQKPKDHPAPAAAVANVATPSRKAAEAAAATTAAPCPYGPSNSAARANRHQSPQKAAETAPAPAPCPYGPNNSANRANRNRGTSPPSPPASSLPPSSPANKAPASGYGQNVSPPRARPAMATATKPSPAPATRHVGFSEETEEHQRRPQRAGTAPASKQPSPTLPTSNSEKNMQEMQKSARGEKEKSHTPKGAPKAAYWQCEHQKTEKELMEKEEARARVRSQSTKSRASRADDPFDIDRFVEQQKESFSRALSEIQAGRKASCWMWWTIPSPPHMKNGIEKGSCLNRRYAIRSDEEAKAYLSWEVDGEKYLRQNYFDILSAVLDHLKAGKPARNVIGGFDEPKLGSSVMMFERISRELGDEEMANMLREVMRFMELQHGA